MSDEVEDISKLKRKRADHPDNLPKCGGCGGQQQPDGMCPGNCIALGNVPALKKGKKK